MIHAWFLWIFQLLHSIYYRVSYYLTALIYDTCSLCSSAIAECNSKINKRTDGTLIWCYLKLYKLILWLFLYFYYRNVHMFRNTCFSLYGLQLCRKSIKTIHVVLYCVRISLRKFVFITWIWLMVDLANNCRPFILIC